MTDKKVRAALLRYRVLAYATGTVLMVLVFVAVPLHYLGDSPGLSRVVAPLHGGLFIIYCGLTLDLSIRLKWPLLKTVLVMLAGTIPIMTFYAERRVTHEVNGLLPAQ
jgi:integral membrane protein